MANESVRATHEHGDVTVIMALSPVIPVVTFASAEDAVPLAMAFMRGGVPVIEVTLRSPAGVSDATAPEYLKLPAVPCVGGSWLTSGALLASRDWARVEFLAKRAAALRPTAG